MGQIGSGTAASFVVGIFIGILGIFGMSANYPVYRKLLAKGKKKYAFDILELAKEISGQ